MHASIQTKERYQTGRIESYRQKKTTIRHSSTRSGTWCYPQPHSCTLQTKLISSLDIAYIKVRPKNDQTYAQHQLLIIFCNFFQLSNNQRTQILRQINKSH